MVSTPNAPGGLFERIEKDKNSKYKKLFLDYSYGFGKIYDAEYIEKKKLEPEFEREYNLKYLGLIGNVFHTKDIENSTAEYDIENEAINIMLQNLWEWTADLVLRHLELSLQDK